MSNVSKFLWYAGVAAAAIGLVASFIYKSWLLAVICACITAVLNATNSKVPLSKVYTDRGIKNSWFSSSHVRDENCK